MRRFEIRLGSQNAYECSDHFCTSELSSLHCKYKTLLLLQNLDIFSRRCTNRKTILKHRVKLQKSVQKVCKKCSDQFASSLLSSSLQKSGPESEILCESDKWLWRYCESTFYLKYPGLQKIGFAISLYSLLRFAANFGIWTRFLQG